MRASTSSCSCNHMPGKARGEWAGRLWRRRLQLTGGGILSECIGTSACLDLQSLHSIVRFRRSPSLPGLLGANLLSSHSRRPALGTDISPVGLSAFWRRNPPPSCRAPVDQCLVGLLRCAVDTCCNVIAIDSSQKHGEADCIQLVSCSAAPAAPTLRPTTACKHYTCKQERDPC